ncbi:hypothetical protein [Cohnella sp. GCM10027633]|uniref:hypothetical protein n=1 Tax=unclassified Cohnella TaxID=2636738 RepID=UPI00362B6825
MLYTTNLNLKKPQNADTVNVEDFNGNADILDAAVQGKVDKVAGRGLSQENYTTTEKSKLAGIASGANLYAHPNHTGDVTSNGDGVTAIAPGVIVNADVHAAAAIDASKIGGGTVDNAEFGYLNGVTGAIQTQLDGKSAVTDYIRQPGFATATGSANAYAVTLSPALAAYAAGVCVAVKINVANTGASTLNVSGLGTKAILDSKGSAMISGKLKADSVYTLRYNGTAFIVQGEGGEYGTAVAADVLAGKTIGTDAGLVSGTMVNRAAITDNLGYSTDGAGYFNFKIPNGAYLSNAVSGSPEIRALALDALPANIRKGKSIFGITGNSLEYGVGSVVPIGTVPVSWGWDGYGVSNFYESIDISPINGEMVTFENRQYLRWYTAGGSIYFSPYLNFGANQGCPKFRRDGKLTVAQQQGRIQCYHASYGGQYWDSTSGAGWVAAGDTGSSPSAVCDTSNNMYHIGPTIGYLQKINENGSFGWRVSLDVPAVSLCIDSTDNIYVTATNGANPGINYLYKYTPGGTQVFRVPIETSSYGGVPQIQYDSKNNRIVIFGYKPAEAKHRIYFYTVAGVLLSSFVAAIQHSATGGLIVDPFGDIYQVSTGAGNGVVRYRSSGTVQETLTFDPIEGFYSPYDGFVYIARGGGAIKLKGYATII